jgi:CBS-domain-containing membrane protein
VRTALRIFTSCFTVLAALGVLALVARQPYLFPSLGPTAMLFFDSPTQPAASPRNTLIGHGVAIAAGVLCLTVFGLLHHPPVLQEGVSWSRVAAAALSAALTATALHLLNRQHPPAGATTLVISLGLFTTPLQWLAVVVAVVLLTALSVALNRLFGVPQPFWS